MNWDCGAETSLRRYWVDLHVHTVLSPCGELEMGAPEIVERARETGIDVIAVTDHNAADNVPALVAAAESGGPSVIAGMEVQTEEDIHVVTLFPSFGDVSDFQIWLWRRMPDRENRPDIFGYQLVIDEWNDILREVKPLLIQGVGYGVDEVISEARSRGGLVILAHVDRPSFSYPAVLGDIPSMLEVHALELSCGLTSEDFDLWRTKYPDRSFVRSSDAHRLSDIGRENATAMFLRMPTFEEITMAIKGIGGRRIVSPWKK